jgi:hypothetical protein
LQTSSSLGLGTTGRSDSRHGSTSGSRHGSLSGRRSGGSRTGSLGGLGLFVDDFSKSRHHSIQALEQNSRDLTPEPSKRGSPEGVLNLKTGSSPRGIFAPKGGSPQSGFTQGGLTPGSGLKRSGGLSPKSSPGTSFVVSTPKGGLSPRSNPRKVSNPLSIYMYIHICLSLSLFLSL